MNPSSGMYLRRELFHHFLSKPNHGSGVLVSVIYLSLCLVLSFWHWDHEGLSNILVAKGHLAITGGEYYRLFTTTYVHGSFAHLLANSTSLAFLLYFVSQYYGASVALGHTFLAGALINFLTLKTMNPEIGLVGASGVVYFLWGFWLTLYLFIDRTVTVSRRFMKITAITILMLVPSTLEPGVSYMAHFLGLVCGILWAAGYFVLYRKKLQAQDRFLIPTGHKDGFSSAPFRADYEPWPFYRPRVSGYKESFLK
jgi:rhomboid protease GluP